MTKKTKIKAIVITILVALGAIYENLDAIIAISWLALYYVVLPISVLYIIKSYLSYKEKIQQNTQKQEMLERERIQKQEMLERERIQKQEMLERERIQKQEMLERERILEEKRNKEKLERFRIIEEKRKQKELDRIRLRDSELQEIPYIYESGTHANEALAIRYGIANPEFKIQLRKIKKLKDSHYKVELIDFRNRHAVAVIETGTEYVKTFMPINDTEWFEKHKDLELVLKGNGSFSLKELATFHVQKTISS